jgi:TonB-dependent SusC/RagA subfamily outer membrane receptor
MNRMLIALLLTALSTTLWANDEPKIYSSSLKSAIVYRSGAELTHTAKLVLAQGNNELVIEGLSSKIDMNSLQIGSSGNLTIMSMEFSTDFMRPVVKSPTVLRLEDSLEALDNEIARMQTLIKTNQELLELLKSNKDIGGTQSGLSVTELTKMVEYYKTKTLELNNEIVSYKSKEAKLLAQHSKLTLQIKEEEKKNTKTSGKLMLQVYSPVSGQQDLTVSYLTPNAAWAPTYDLRMDNIAKPLQISYKAKLVQTSGIDWQQVKLSLSTSVPAQRNIAPNPQTWFLGYISPNLGYYDKERKDELARPQSSVGEALNGTAYGAVRIRGMSTIKQNIEPLYVVDGNIVSALQFNKIDKNSIKNITTLKDAAATNMYGARGANGVIVVNTKDDLGEYISIRDNQLNVVFEIDLPYDVPSNGKEQSVVLKDFRLPASYNYFTAPNIEMDAYLLGELPDWESLNLLPGEANIIFEGTYTGRTYIDPSSTEDTLHLTLGRDKRVVVTREMLKDFSSVKFFGSNKKQTLTYEITVKNNKKEKIQITLKDQYPVTMNKDIEVELLQSDGAIVNQETGLLTWKPELAPGEVKKYRISYSVKYPKDKKVNLN